MWAPMFRVRPYFCDSYAQERSLPEDFADDGCNLFPSPCAVQAFG